MTHDCAAKLSSNHILMFTADSTVVGLISNNDESAYKEEVVQLADYCRDSNLPLVDLHKE